MSIPNRRIHCLRKPYLFLAAFVSLVLLYAGLPKLLFKTPWTHVGWMDPDFHLSIRAAAVKERREMVILRWTKEWHNYENVQVLNRQDCPYLTTPSTLPPTSLKGFDIPCRLTFDRRYLKRSDALAFHSFDLMSEEVPMKRDPNQPWVYMQRECPMYTKLDLQAYSNVFNWTMTYRRDSDVYHTYGHLVPKTKESNEVQGRIKSKLRSRREQVAWIVSSCDSYSKREYLVAQLRKYVNVDVYGGCGLKCPSENCYADVSHTHKFYLSFENALCTDYITEKFYNALRTNMVPVVYGGKKSRDYAAIAPIGSYIDVRDFKSPKELADYLLYLDKNDEEYIKYFEWKRTLKVIHNQGWCNLCQRVYAHLELDSELSTLTTKNSKENSFKVRRSRHKWYKDLWRWWNYISYGIGIEIEDVSKLSRLDEVTSSSYNYKLGVSACSHPLENLTKMEGERVRLGFGPGLFNGAIFGKVAGWVKDRIIPVPWQKKIP